MLNLNLTSFSAFGQYDPIANLLSLPVGLGSPGLLAVRGPIYVDGSSLSPANNPGNVAIIGPQMQPQIGAFSPYNTYNPQTPVQFMYDENHLEPTSRRRATNENTQREIQQIGTGNMNLQGNIQQVNWKFNK